MKDQGDGIFDGVPHDWPAAGFAECPPSALKILLAIIHHWVAGGFKNNGNLVVTYKMLRLATGIKSKTTLSLGLEQLEALGMLTTNRGKWSITGTARQPNRYGLTWKPIDGRLGGSNGGPATKEYLEITTRKEAQERLKAVKERRKNPKEQEVMGVVEFKAKLKTIK
jgi:hypothetical protein